MNIHIQAAEIGRIADALAAMCSDDERLFADMLEGETDLHWLITRLHNGIATDAGMVLGIKDRQADLSERKKRLEGRIDAQRGAIIQLMRAGKVSKVELPEATYSLRDGKAKLSVVDADAVPMTYLREKYEIDKTAINEAFADAVALPNWLVWTDAEPVLTQRTK